MWGGSGLQPIIILDGTVSRRARCGITACDLSLAGIPTSGNAEPIHLWSDSKFLNACLQSSTLACKSKTPTNGKEAQAALPSVCRGSSEDLFFTRPPSPDLLSHRWRISMCETRRPMSRRSLGYSRSASSIIAAPRTHTVSGCVCGRGRRWRYQLERTGLAIYSRPSRSQSVRCLAIYSGSQLTCTMPPSVSPIGPTSALHVYVHVFRYKVRYPRSNEVTPEL